MKSPDIIIYSKLLYLYFLIMFCSKYTFKITNWDNMDVLHCTMGVCVCAMETERHFNPVQIMSTRCHPCTDCTLYWTFDKLFKQPRLYCR